MFLPTILSYYFIFPILSKMIYIVIIIVSLLSSHSSSSISCNHCSVSIRSTIRIYLSITIIIGNIIIYLSIIILIGIMSTIILSMITIRNTSFTSTAFLLSPLSVLSTLSSDSSLHHYYCHFPIIIMAIFPSSLSPFSYHRWYRGTVVVTAILYDLILCHFSKLTNPCRSGMSTVQLELLSSISQ